MIKIVSFIRRHPDMTPDEFRTYWTEVHAPLVRARLPGLIRYTGSFPVADAHDPVAVDAVHHDLIVEMAFPDRKTMEAEMGSPAFAAADRVASSMRFMDMEASRAIVLEEVDALP